MEIFYFNISKNSFKNVNEFIRAVDKTLKYYSQKENYRKVKDSSVFRKMLEELSKNENWEVRRCIAGYQYAPLEILENLSKDFLDEKNSPLVRAAVARNPSISGELLRKLSKDRSWIVRRGVVENPNVSLKMLENFLKDRSLTVKRAVAENKKTSDKILEELAKIEGAGTAKFIRVSVAQHPNVTEKILEKLSHDPEPEVRMGVAQNKKTSLNILQALSDDFLDKNLSCFVRSMVAGNPNATEEILIKLSKDESYIVRKAVRDNRNTPVEIRKKLLGE